MTFEEAQKSFESKFSDVTHDEKQYGDKGLTVCWSGGTRTWEETSPALYATKEMAINMWLAEAEATKVEGTKLHWVLRPELLEYQITIADKMGRHRSVNNRFAVKSQFKGVE